MKKVIMLVLIGVLLTGCGNKDATSKNGTLSADGYEFVSAGTTITMNKEAKEIIAKLGTYKDYYETASCAFDGLDKQYFYEGFQVDTYPMDGVDYISMVYIEKENIPTKEGVKVGDTADKVKETYGTEYKEDMGSYIYTSGKSQLKFYLESNVVSAIEYIAITK